MPASKAPADLSILLIEDDAHDARLFRELLFDAAGEAAHIEWKRTLTEGITASARLAADVVVLDLCLPDSRGLPTLKTFLSRNIYCPVVVLTSLEDEEMAAEAIGHGAQDYLVKDQIDAFQLMRVLRYARQRHDHHPAPIPAERAFLGFSNREQFFSAARTSFSLSQQIRFPLLLLLLNVLQLRSLNDEFGREEADKALEHLAAAILATAAPEDCLAYMGGSEFAVLQVDTGQRDPENQLIGIREVLGARPEAATRALAGQLRQAALRHDPAGDSNFANFEALLAAAGAKLQAASGRPADSRAGKGN